MNKKTAYFGIPKHYPTISNRSRWKVNLLIFGEKLDIKFSRVQYVGNFKKCHFHMKKY